MQATSFLLVEPGRPLRRGARELGERQTNEAIVEVHACGLCHTDLGFFDGSVRPKHELPLVLGHEIAGHVIEADDSSLIGQPVIVPAVLPCGDCAYCKGGRDNACPNQKMPGNDVHGGFSTHVLVPAAPLVHVPEALAGRLDELSVVADAVSTAYQAVDRAGLVAGDVAFVVGAGGSAVVGPFHEREKVEHVERAGVGALEELRPDRGIAAGPWGAAQDASGFDQGIDGWGFLGARWPFEAPA